MKTMWTYSQLGFWSAIASSDPNILIVRGRAIRDIRRLQMLLVVLEHDMPKISEGGGSDYPFRVRVTRPQYSDALTALATNLTYRNFKAQVEETQGLRRARLYSRLWAVTRELEELGEDD